MNILGTLSDKAEERRLRFLVIGGLAINAHGYERQTADVDIMAVATDREAWTALMPSLGYVIFHEQNTFVQFSPPATGTWPIDVMFVNEKTFSAMFSEAVEVKVDGVPVKIPAVEHLIALKLHSLKYANPRRELKDLLDIVSLVEANGIDLHGEKLKQLCERYGSKKVLKQIIAASSR